MILIAEEIHPALMDGLTESRIPFHYKPEISLEEVLLIIAEYDGIVVRSKFTIDKNFIDKATHLKFIARAGSGTDNIDAEYAGLRNIELLSAPEALRDAVAEHTLGLILALHHKLIQAHNEVKNGEWNREHNRGIELKGKTVGIIGYGNTGSAIAGKLKGFGVNVITYDKYKEPVKGDDGSFFFDANATSVNLDTIYEQADIITLHIPLTKETIGWVNKKFFDQLRRPIIFINCARGKIVNTNDLIEAIQNKIVRGAGLDVLEEEPPFNLLDQASWFDTINQMPNVIFTPHVAGWSVESYERISIVLCEKIIAFYNGKSN